MEKNGRLKSPLNLDLGIVRARPSEKILSGILSASFSGNSYGEPRADTLRRKLGERLGIPAEGMVVGNGSLEILSAISRAFLKKGSVATMPTPTFFGYSEFASREGARLNLIESEKSGGGQFSSGIEGLLVEAKGADVLFLCSPNNPTGTVFSEGQISELCERAKGIVVLDQALIDPLDREGVRLVGERRNLVIVRTFSKTRALAGLRIGFSLSCRALAERISKELLPFGVNSVSQRAALESIEDGEFQEELEALRKERLGFFLGLLEEAGLEVAGVCPNTVLLDLGNPSSGKEIVRRLAERNVFVFGGDSFDFTGLSNRFARISLPTEKEAETFVRILKEELDSLSLGKSGE